jgi:hypothetical protein
MNIAQVDCNADAKYRLVFLELRFFAPKLETEDQLSTMGTLQHHRSDTRAVQMAYKQIDIISIDIAFSEKDMLPL